MTPKMSDRMRILLEALELGIELPLESGHTLAWSVDHNAPGFLVHVQSTAGGVDLDMDFTKIFQIGSDAAWMGLIWHAKSVTEEELDRIAQDVATLKKTGESSNG